MRRRLASAVGAALVGSLLVVPALAGPASAAKAPVVTKVGDRSGPVKPTVITIRGNGLKKVTAVKFGKKKAKVVKRVSAKAIKVRTPKGMKPGTVKVFVKTKKSTWSSPTKRSRYTFVARPKITKLSRRTGDFAGDQQVRITGRALARVQRVTFGDQRARIVKRTKKAVVVRTPLGVLGSAPVRVTTRGGTSKPSKFAYVAPQTPRVTQVVTAKADALLVQDVQWVTGGMDHDTGELTPWVVSLAAGSTVPTVGQPFAVEPGAAAFPSGLAGKVVDVAVQVDESVRVTVEAAHFDTVFSDLKLGYTGPVDMSAARSARTSPGATGGLEPAEVGNGFEITGPSALLCTDDRGASVGFSSAFSVDLADQDVSAELDMGGFVRRPNFDVAYTAEFRTTGKITVEGAATCELKRAWSNAQRRIIPVGGGVTLSVAPVVKLKFSGQGTYQVDDITRATLAAHVTAGSRPVTSQATRTVRSTHTGSVSLNLELAGGGNVRLGVLDRAGIEGNALLGIEAGLAAKTSPARVCVNGSVFFRFEFGMFLDFFVGGFNGTLLNVTQPLLSLREICSTPAAPEHGSEPEISTTRLPDATIGDVYSAQLETADGRPGTWQALGAGMPAGLVLLDDGSITGRPTGPVGDRAVLVEFVDDAGDAATSTVRINVLPEAGVGGGDLQVQLRWTGPADLDLHMEDPAGEEIYFANRLSASGGQLDHDANAACNGEADDDNAVENIFWPSGGAPAGAYSIWVHTWSECSTDELDWTLTVRRNGVVVLEETGYGDSEYMTVNVGPAGRVSLRRDVPVPPRIADRPVEPKA